MRVDLVPSAPPGQPQLFSSYVIDGVVAIDAGCLDRVGDLGKMAAIKHIFLTHVHLDHVASLPPFLDAVYDGSGDCVIIHGNAHTLDSLRRDLFNNRVYPDFLHISTYRPPFLKLEEVVPGQVIEIGDLKITPVEVNHLIPALGYLVEDAQASVVFSGDTGPTEELWKVAARSPRLRAVFLECTFPAALEWLAEIACHLTPPLYAQEMRKLGRLTRYITVHLHPRHREVVIAELEALQLPGVEIGQPGVTYLF